MEKAGWWNGLERPRRIMLIAIGLLFISQFFAYGEKTNYHLIDPGAAFYTEMGSQEVEATGWELHPLAGPIILGLFLLFAMRFDNHPQVRRWRYWAAVVLFIVATSPAAPVRAFGAMLGVVALGLAVWSAIMARKAAA